MKNRTRSVLVYTIMLLVFATIIQISQLRKEVEFPFYVSVTADGEKETLEAWENENGEFYFFLPGYAQLKDIQLVKRTENPIYMDGLPILDGMSGLNFQLNREYLLSCTAWGIDYERTVTFVQSANVHTMYIDTASGSMAYIHAKKGNEEAGTLRLYSETGELVCAEHLDSINGRGNYTWNHFEKKAYSIKCVKEVDLLDMGSAQKWILLANAADATHLRNKVVYEFADAVGLPYSPDAEWVDLYLNSEYAGLYLLCERNEVQPNRVDIDQINGALVSLEPEDRLKAHNYLHIVTQEKHALRIHYPQDATGEYLEELTAKWQSFENAMLAEDGRDPLTDASWLEQIDLDSWVRKYLIEELFGNYDAGNISQYFYTDETGRIYAGPVWDYDLTMGLETTWQLKNPQSFFANRDTPKDGAATPWFYHLYKKEIFHDRLVEIYEREFLPRVKDLLDSIDEYATGIATASAVNEIRWGNITNQNLEERIDSVKDYLEERVAFLNRVWLEDASYCLIRADNGFGVNYAYYAVMYGDCLEEVPMFEDTDTSIFCGWYYSDSNEIFDITKPITEDIEIYAKWQDKPSKKLDQLAKLAPLGIIAVMGIGLVCIEFKRWKKCR